MSAFDWDDAPTLAECQRDEAEAACLTSGHVLGYDEDGEVVCERCGSQALDVEEPESASDPDSEPGPDGDLLDKHAEIQALVDYDVPVETFGIPVASRFYATSPSEIDRQRYEA